MPASPLRNAAGTVVANAYFLPADESGALELSAFAALDSRLAAAFAVATAVAIFLTVLLSRRITSPLERLTAAIEGLARGESPARMTVSGRDEIAQLARAFNDMSDALRAQEELQRRMVSDVAHELRTPLTNLRCELEAIQDGLAPPDPARIVSLHEEILHLGRLVDDLQVLALADAGGLSLQREAVDLAALARRIAEPYRSQAIAVDVAAGDPVVLHADPVRLGQVVQNLLTNAARHTPAGGRIRVAVGIAGSEARLTVSDSGPGIPPDELERIFERFYRLDAARHHDGGGAGLGLAIVRRLVELHGGRVWATSETGAGATFEVALPLERRSDRLAGPLPHLHNPFISGR